MSFVRWNKVGHLAICASAQYALAAMAQGAKIASFVSVAGWYHSAATVAPFYGGAQGCLKRLHDVQLAHEAFISNGALALLASSIEVFGIFQCAGAAYLIGLGLYRLVGRRASFAPESLTTQQAERERPGSLVLQAFFTLNPKTAIFFLALFPQFIEANAAQAWRQILLPGCTFVILGLTTHSLYGCIAGTIASVAKANQRFHSASRYISGVVLIGMGITAGINCSLPRPV